jgi:hypothetical protein
MFRLASKGAQPVTGRPPETTGRAPGAAVQVTGLFLVPESAASNRSGCPSR